jgi:hypothetical protein
VQSQADHFVISFFETFAPPIKGETDDEKRAMLDTIDSLDAMCIARIVVTPTVMERVIDALERNYTRWQQDNSPK